MKKPISAALAAAALLVLAACGASPTSSEVAAPADWQANTVQSDSVNSRVPNMFGSGN